MSNSSDLENSLSDDPIEEVAEETTDTPNEEPNNPEQVLEEAPPTDETAEEVIKKLFQVKVDGEELEVDEDELIRNYQLRVASDKKFSEANLGRKQNEEFIRLLKTDPKSVLTHPSIGLDLRKFAEDFLVGELQNDMLTPEEKQLKEYQTKLADFEAREKEAKDREEAEAADAVSKKYAEDYNNQIVTALEDSGLPKTEHTVQRMIKYMHDALKNGYELEAKDVTDLVRRDYQTDLKALTTGLDADALVQILGDDLSKKIRKYDLDKIKNPQNDLTEPVDVSRTPKDKKKEMLTKDEWREMIANIKD